MENLLGPFLRQMLQDATNFHFPLIRLFGYHASFLLYVFWSG